MIDREIIKIAVSPRAKEEIEQACKRYGMSQIELASRIYTWFSHQDEVLQTAILNILPKTVEADIAKLILNRMTSSQSPPDKPPQTPPPPTAPAKPGTNPRPPRSRH